MSYELLNGREDTTARCKNWVFTLNNYTPVEEQAIRDLGSSPQVIYIVFGREEGEEQGTPHLQGTICFQERQRFRQAKRILGERCHLEKMKGTPLQASDYCKKDDDFEEFGDLPGGAGCRSDLVALKNDIDAGKRLSEIADTHFGTYLRYHRGINLYRGLKATPRTWETLVIVYWGNTGTGKTRAVHENATDLYTHVGGNWFDGYDGEKQVLFDEFCGSDFKLSYLLKLLDRYPMQVPIKGGFVNWAPQEIYIATNLNPDEWYRTAHREHVNALKRRFSFVYHFE